MFRFASRLAPVAAAAALTAVTAACGGGASSQANAVIRIDGSSTVFPISEAVAEEFQKTHADTRVTVGISGTGGGFQKFCRGEIDIADASRPIQPTELDACRGADIGFIELPIAYDGIAVVVNPRASWIASITVDELKRIWAPEAQGTVTRWNQVRPDWPDREIHLFGAGVDSGTYDYFTLAVTGTEGASRGDFTSSEDDNVLVQGVGNDQLALGFLPYAYYEENRASLKLVPVEDGKADNGEGAIAPTQDTVRDGTYQPLSRPVFLYIAERSLERPAVANFVDYYLAEGGALAEEVGYVQLGDDGYALVKAHFAARRTGTVFGNGSTVGVTLGDLLSRERSR